MSVDFQTSKTKQNLMRAFAGEAQARERYYMAEERARAKKLFSVAELFRFTADQEKVHGEIFYSHIGGSCGEEINICADYPAALSDDPLVLLRESVNNESREHREIYPEFARVAREEGFSDIAQDFENIASIENTHGERFRKFADLLGQGKLYSSDKSEMWICLNCGYICEGTQAPETCPVCSQPQGWYIRLDEARWGKCSGGESEC